MGWEHRDYAGNDGGDRGVLRRIFGGGENPLGWSLPLYTAWGIRVRIHLVYILIVIGYLIYSITPEGFGLPYMAIAMANLFVLVLLHEYGHCFACRWVGGTADQILMWPLGGLAYCVPPHHWRPSLITTIGGPAVNVLLVPILGGALWIAVGVDPLIFNPFEPKGVVGAIQSPSSLRTYGLIALWWAYYANWLLLAFNILLPMYPMDGGRIVQEILWARMGYRRATSISATLGLVIAIGLFVFSMIGGSTTLMSIALFGGVTCWIEKRRLAMTGDEEGIPGYDFSRGYQGMPRDDDDESDRSAAKRAARERAEQDKLDAILAKIARDGMGSLSWRERAWLKRTTEKRRRA